MDHPCPGWKPTTHKLKRDIWFTKLVKRGPRKIIDHDRCLRWEVQRTRYYVDKNFKKAVDKAQKEVDAHRKSLKKAGTQTARDKILTNWYLRKSNALQVLFPYYVGEWPCKAYFSVPPKRREKWKDAKDEGVENRSESPFCDKLYKGSSEPSESIPLTLHVRVDWTKERFVEIFEKYSNEILKQVEIEKEKLSSKGFSFVERSAKKPISTYQKRLKVLAHFRLHECAKLDYPEVCGIYQKNVKQRAYDYEVFRTEIDNFRKNYFS
jgi:hypothetical protein